MSEAKFLLARQWCCKTQPLFYIKRIKKTHFLPTKKNWLQNAPYKMSQFPSLPQTNNWSNDHPKHSKRSELQICVHLKNQISDDWRVQLKPTLCPGCFYHWGVHDSTTLGHKDCENLWDLLDLCLTCGNPVILPTTFPQNNGWRLWRLSSRKIVFKKTLVHNILRHQESTAKGPTN